MVLRLLLLMSRSTWACELKFVHLTTLLDFPRVTLHVSVWVEIDIHPYRPWIRMGHAPRERVSWNLIINMLVLYKRKSRSTWACELKFNRQRKNLCRHWSRSTWACELKFHDLRHISASVMVTLHVSVWVEIFIPMLVIQPNYVTLHVSVWVEIDKKLFFLCFYASRSTWACELK